MLESQFCSYGVPVPPKCLPSPRTVARVASNSRRQGVAIGTPFSLRRGLQRFETVLDDVELNSDSSPSPGRRSSPRTHPISYPACDPPLCSDCRQFDAKFSPVGSDDDDTFKLLLDPDRPLTPDISEEDVVRMMLTAAAANGSGGFHGKVRGAWWCEKCVSLLSSPDVGIGNLFALLRQWTPCTQLQIDTIVMEILKRGAHVDDRDGMTDMTLLHYTAKSGALGNEDLACKIADFLLDQGACLEARSGWEDMTPLHFAAYFDCPKVAQLLLCRGADPLVRSAALEGATPLHMAAAQLSLSTARLLAHVPLSVGLPGEPNPDFAPLESPLTCKEALDACLRTPYDCLPPAGELPEPLSSMRDRLAELLGPPVDSKTKQQLVFLGAGCAHSEYRVLPALQHAHVQSDHANPRGGLSHVVGGVRSATTLIADVDPSRKLSDGDKRKMSNDISGSLFSGFLAPARSATEVAAPMPAETGVLSPRRPRRTTVASTEPNTPFTSPSRSAVAVASPPPLHPPPIPTQINHPVPTTSSVSAKVTLQAMGLALGDRVCVGPGSSSSSSGGTALSPKPTTSGRMGRLRYCGPVEFASGIWVGIELDEAFGKNDGSVNGVTYFECTEKHGIFAPIGRVYKVSRSSGQVRPFCVEPNGKRATPTPVQNTPIDVSHVGAKVDTGLHKSVALDDIKIGDKVLVAGLRRGIVRFIGETQFAPGVWYGVELSKAVGKNDGSVDGVRYFTCEPKHGVFAPVLRLQKLPSRNRPASSDSFDMSQSLHADFLRDWSSSSCSKCPMTPDSSHRRSPSAGGATSSMYADTYASLGRMRPATALSRGANRTGSSGRPAAEDFCLQIGMQVLCTGELGTLRYIGPVNFTDGLWLGVELRGPHGKHDGAVAGCRYFTCPPNHGVLVRPSRVTFRGISAAKLLPPSLAVTFERPSKGETLDTRSVQSHP